MSWDVFLREIAERIRDNGSGSVEEAVYRS